MFYFHLPISYINFFSHSPSNIRHLLWPRHCSGPRESVVNGTKSMVGEAHVLKGGQSFRLCLGGGGGKDQQRAHCGWSGARK